MWPISLSPGLINSYPKVTQGIYLEMGLDAEKVESMIRRKSSIAKVSPCFDHRWAQLTTTGCLRSLEFREMDLRNDDVKEASETTCTWLPTHPSYLSWLQAESSLLWVMGKSGAGKSTLMKHALTIAEKPNNQDWIVASYFFHGRSGSLQKSALGLFRSLLHQLMQLVPRFRSAFGDEFHRKCDTQGEHPGK